MHATDVDIVELKPSEVLVRRREIARLWPEASRERVDDILPRHAARDGFRFLGGFGEDATLAGFVYGYCGGAGQWWHDRVAKALGPVGSDRWLAAGHFEFTELHVAPESRRRGIGGALHDAILSLVDAPTAVLST